MVMASSSLRAPFGPLVALMLVVGCTSDDSVSPATPGLRIIDGAPASDTVRSAIQRPLVVEVVDEDGHPAAGRVVRFESIAAPAPDEPSFGGFRVYLRNTDTAGPGDILVVDTTDSRGRASAYLKFSYKAGDGQVAITVPEFGYRDTADYVVRPGNPAGVDLTPADTAVYVGQTVALRGRTVDTYGNGRQDPVSYAVVNGPGTVDAGTGLLSVSAIGRLTLVARSGSTSDTAHVSVVPRAELAAQRFYTGNGGPIGIFQVETNGTVIRRLSSGIDNSWVTHGWEWSPDGRQLVIPRGTFINLLTPGGTERPVIELNAGISSLARFSRDGAWIYFTVSEPGMRLGPYRVRTDGSDLQPLGPAVGYGMDYWPAPSHDGLSVAYGSQKTPCGVDSCIRVLDIATNEIRKYGTRDYLARGQLASWSPVGNLIAYVDRLRIAVIRADGTGDRTLVEGRGADWLDWSPDGQWLVVSSPVMLIHVQSGLQLPIAQLRAYGPAAWRP